MSVFTYNYTTNKGNTLEVVAIDCDGEATPRYDFYLHEKKKHGENITPLLLNAPLWTPCYFLKKYTEKY